MIQCPHKPAVSRSDLGINKARFTTLVVTRTPTRGATAVIPRYTQPSIAGAYGVRRHESGNTPRRFSNDALHYVTYRYLITIGYPTMP